MKKVILLTLCILLLVPLCAGAKTLEFTIGSNIMYESDNGIQKSELENAPYTQNNRTMVPVRIISEKFGAEVGWDGEKNEVTIKKDDKTIVLTLGSAEAFVNSDAITLDVVPEEKNGRTMVPLRFISETMGMMVGYVESTSQILITDEQPIITINDVNISIDDYRSLLAYMGYTPSMENEAEFINEATKTLVQLYAAEGGLTADGKSDFSVIGQFYQEAGSEIYKQALFAPLAQLFEADIKVGDYITSFIESMDFEKYVNDYYSNNYVLAKHILVLSEERGEKKAEAEAQKILDRINKGEDFDELMFELSEDPGLMQYPDGYLFTKGKMVPEFEEGAFGLEVGAVSEIIKTSYGYHIIKREALPKLSQNDAGLLGKELSEHIYADVINDSIDLSKIVQYKTTEEIIKILK